MPESNVRQHYKVLLGLIRRTCNFTVAVIWLYQGLVPKLLGPHSDELAMSGASGVSPEWQASVSYAAGVGEVLLGMCILLVQRSSWPLLVCTFGVVASWPRLPRTLL